jgi:putative peptide zinc metalloprotease protein
MMALIALIVVAEVAFFTVETTVFSVGHVDVMTIVGILALLICSSIVHEFGHATACSYCETTPRGIGFGLYINFPVFYTDVSDIWKLSRRNRMLVNLGGVYFQSLFLLPLFAIFFITGNNILKYFIFTINLNFIFTLNPFFKFDGYWIMTDLLGVPNLRARSKEVFKYYWGVIRGSVADQRPFILTLKKSTKIFFICYSVIVNLFFLYYFCYILPKFVGYFIKNFPDMVKQFVNMIAMGNMPTMGLLMGVFGQILMLALMLFMIYKMIVPLIKKLAIHKNV